MDDDHYYDYTLQASVISIPSLPSHLCVPDDNAGWRCWARAGGHTGPILWGNCVLSEASQEELEEHLQLVWRGEDTELPGFGEHSKTVFGYCWGHLVYQARVTFKVTIFCGY